MYGKNHLKPLINSGKIRFFILEAQRLTSATIYQAEPCEMISNNVIFYGKGCLASRSNPRLEVHPLSVVRDCLIRVFTATLHI
jgi:hypothetical protein